MLTASLLGRAPANNPAEIFLKIAFSGNAGVLGTGDALDLTPVSGANANGITDPGGLGGPFPCIPLTIPPCVEVESLGGYYVQPTLGSTLLNCALRMFAPGGTEVLSNTAYNTLAIAGGNVASIGYVILKIMLPQEQT